MTMSIRKQFHQLKLNTGQILSSVKISLLAMSTLFQARASFSWSNTWSLFAEKNNSWVSYLDWLYDIMISFRTFSLDNISSAKADN